MTLSPDRLDDPLNVKLIEPATRADPKIYAIARALRNVLAPACERIEIAGSIRRGKENPKDIELVAIPKLLTDYCRTDMFDEPEARTTSLLDPLIYHHTNEDPNHLRDGPRYKRRLRGPYKVDLFIVLPPAQWGVIFFLRTGPAQPWNINMVKRWTTITHGGHCTAGHLRTLGGAIIDTPEEADVFEALKLDYIAPEHRQ